MMMAGKAGPPGPRAGFSLVELLIAVVLTAVIVSAMTGVFTGQARLFGQQDSQRSARSVSRSAANALMIDLRMVEATGGVEAASATAVTLRVPYGIGVICSTSATEATVSLLPVDSVLFTLPGYSGYAWRGADGGYVYMAGSQDEPDVVGAAPAACASESITTVPSGTAVRLTPGVDPDLGAGAGTPVLLYRRIRYELVPAAELHGRSGIFRTTLDGDGSTLLAGPFAGGSRFRFFVDGSAEPQDEPPADLAALRGLQLDLEGLPVRPPAPGQPAAEASLNTAIFFNNAAQ